MAEPDAVQTFETGLAEIRGAYAEALRAARSEPELRLINGRYVGPQGELTKLLKLMPKLGWILSFTAMASLGLPGLAGFWGEFMALLGAYNPLPGLDTTLFRTAMVVGAIGTVLTAGYLLWMLQKVNLGEPKAEWEGKEFHDMDVYEATAWVPLLLFTVLLGVYPRLVFGATTPAVEALVQRAFGG